MQTLQKCQHTVKNKQQLQQTHTHTQEQKLSAEMKI